MWCNKATKKIIFFLRIVLHNYFLKEYKLILKILYLKIDKIKDSKNMRTDKIIRRECDVIKQLKKSFYFSKFLYSQSKLIWLSISS